MNSITLLTPEGSIFLEDLEESYWDMFLKDMGVAQTPKV